MLIFLGTKFPQFYRDNTENLCLICITAISCYNRLISISTIIKKDEIQWSIHSGIN